MAHRLLCSPGMTSNHPVVRDAGPVDPREDDLIEITDDMIIELQPAPARGKLLHFPPPLPAAAAGPAPRVMRRRRGLFRIVIGN
jgi:hypothetical protein